MNENTTPSPRRRWWRIAAWIMGSAFALLLLVPAGAACWLWSWQWNSGLSFHESWTTEEKAALADFDFYLRNQLGRDLEKLMNASAEGIDALNAEMPIGELPTPPTGLAARLAADLVLRLQVAPIASALEEVAESGKGDPAVPVSTLTGETNITPAILAAQTAHLPALRALIAHGANPNTIMTCSSGKGKPVELETPITPLLSGNFINGQSLSWEKRREMLDFMLQHGADLNGTQKIISTSLTVALLMHLDASPWQWALDHGKSVSHEDFRNMIGSGDAARSDLVARLLREKRIDVNDTTGDDTALQRLAECMVYCDVEELENGSYEKELELMLAAGANPNLTTENTHRTPLQILEQRTDFERADGMPENSCCTAGPDIRTRWQMICDKVRAAAAGHNMPLPTDEDEEADDEEEIEEEDDSEEEYEEESEYDEESEEEL